MAGLVPAIHAFVHATKNVDARDKPGHDVILGRSWA
jgi:acyl-CoA dehydrogenase